MQMAGAGKKLAGWLAGWRPGWLAWCLLALPALVHQGASGHPDREQEDGGAGLWELANDALKVYLKEHRLKVSGTKSELAQRVLDDIGRRGKTLAQLPEGDRHKRPKQL